LPARLSQLASNSKHPCPFIRVMYSRMSTKLSMI
jgi:hypothetical protein